MDVRLLALKAEVERIRSSFEGSLEFDAPLSKVAYYRIGGRATVLATPRSLSDLKTLHQIVLATECRFFILGWGSNLLFSDRGFSGLVIRMKHLFTGIDEEGSDRLKLGASLGCSVLLKEAGKKGYEGFSRLTGIPGSVGGMITMNAGTHLGEIKDLCLETEFVKFGAGNFEIERRIHEPSDFSYRRNHFLKPGDLILHTYVKKELTDPSIIKSEIEETYQRRKSTQPVEYPSCGSVFMNPKDAGLHAWQVVEKLGLRGHRIGNAQISEKHPNFIVNLGGATADNVKELIELAKSRAQAELGIALHEEVKIIS